MDVAQQIIAMSGKSDVEIQFTGLRGGEKLHEELFGDDQVVRRTAHDLVRAVEVPPLAGADVTPEVDWSQATTDFMLGGAG